MQENLLQSPDKAVLSTKKEGTAPTSKVISRVFLGTCRTPVSASSPETQTHGLAVNMDPPSFLLETTTTCGEHIGLQAGEEALLVASLTDLHVQQVGVEGRGQVAIALVRDHVNRSGAPVLDLAVSGVNVPLWKQAKRQEHLRDLLNELEFIGKLRQLLWQFDEVVLGAVILSVGLEAHEIRHRSVQEVEEGGGQNGNVDVLPLEGEH
ncbi:hypothetical protein EYF80_003081 [Liparis tanakae]|uniref:Uncharacterized protein n=1 Tax=Liparis tanakae TaxID=230148 RepID=A0A4Z2JA63_9TELE|nr:hypothetical protein EYF80_003081 [Liparis tanakae]